MLTYYRLFMNLEAFQFSYLYSQFILGKQKLNKRQASISVYIRHKHVQEPSLFPLQNTVTESQFAYLKKLFCMLIPEIFPLLYSFLPAASSNCSRSELPSPNVGSVLLQMELGLVSLSEHSDVTMRGSHRCCLWKVCLQFREC